MKKKILVKIFFYFIKAQPEYKLSGLYIIDAIIREFKGSKEKSLKNFKTFYVQRFSKNMCKTFTILFEKCPTYERVRIIYSINEIFKKN
jgi:hypothetical protein